MTTNAKIGKDTQFLLGDGASPETFNLIAEVYDLSPPDDEDDEVEVTHFQSAGKEFIFGFPDFGLIEFDMNFLPGSASETNVLAAKAARVQRNWKIIFPGGQIWTGAGLVKGYKPAVPVGDRMTCTVTIRVTGSVTRT